MSEAPNNKKKLKINHNHTKDNNSTKSNMFLTDNMNAVQQHNYLEYIKKLDSK